jgi:hypothetical protein
VKLALLAVLTRVSCGVFTGVVTVLVQLLAPGHDGSPPPDALPVFVTEVPARLACGVTGIANATGAFVARPAAIVHVTVWPRAEQPKGSVPIVRPVGIVSVIVVSAVVAAVPVFVSVSV